MSERYTLAMALQEEARVQEELEKENIRLREQEEERLWELHEAAKMKRDRLKTAVPKFKERARNAMMTEALSRICIRSIKNPTALQESSCRAMVGNYVKERGGADEMMGNFCARSSFLESLATLIDRHVDALAEEVDPKDPDSMVITKQNMDDFFEDLDNTENVEDITNTIRIRVANAEEDFVNKVAMDKENLKTIISDTSERIKDARPGMDNEFEGDDSEDDIDEGPDVPEKDLSDSGDRENDEPEEDDHEEEPENEDESDEEHPKDDDEDDEDVEESYYLFGGDTRSAIFNEQIINAKKLTSKVKSRPKSVFEKMVYNLSEAAIKNDSLRDQYVNESGRLNTQKVIDAVKCMYTMLEAVSTLKIEKVDAQYIEDTIKSIK